MALIDKYNVVKALQKYFMLLCVRYLTLYYLVWTNNLEIKIYHLNFEILARKSPKGIDNISLLVVD